MGALGASGSEGSDGSRFFAFPYYNTCALAHNPALPAGLGMQLVVAVATDAPPRSRGIQFKLLIRQLLPAMITFSHS